MDPPFEPENREATDIAAVGPRASSPFAKEEMLVTVGAGDANLQEAFAKFREQRKSDRKLIKACTQVGGRSQEFKDALRQKFIDQARVYLGVPYHEKYREDGSPLAPLYLDCCGIIRQVMKDLKQDFGFLIGRWNQVINIYHADTFSFLLR